MANNQTEKSELFKAVRHLALDKDVTQQDVSDNINRANRHFWDRLDNNNVRFDHLMDAAEYLDADIIIRSRSGRKLEYVVNIKK